MALDQQTPSSDNQTGFDEFRCDICGDEFDSVSDLTDHKQSHMTPMERSPGSRREILRNDIGAPGLPTSP